MKSTGSKKQCGTQSGPGTNEAAGSSSPPQRKPASAKPATGMNSHKRGKV